MDHFQHSMAVRERILADRPLIKKLAAHFLEGRKLDETLGNGTNNIHYRAGMLSGGLWVATRERFVEPIPYGDAARSEPGRARMRETGQWKPGELEIFCKEAYCLSELFGFRQSVREFASSGGLGYVTSFSIGVRYKPSWKERPLYALLIEDLTAGGAFAISKRMDDDAVGHIEGVRGQVRMDLDDWPRHVKKHREIPDYFGDGSILELG